MEQLTTKKKPATLKESLEWLLAQSPWAHYAPSLEDTDCQHLRQPLLDLSESIEWLLGKNGQNEDSALSESDRLARHERRLELLVWLLNLEKRLPPYGDEQPA